MSAAKRVSIEQREQCEPVLQIRITSPFPGRLLVCLSSKSAQDAYYPALLKYKKKIIQRVNV